MRFIKKVIVLAVVLVIGGIYFLAPSDVTNEVSHNDTHTPTLGSYFCIFYLTAEEEKPPS